MTQKLIQVGNSAGVTFSKEFIDAVGAKVGAKIQATYVPDIGRVIIDIPLRRTNPKDIVDKEVYAVAKDLLKRYLPAFKELARQ